jgi:hypothetical protein
MKLVVDARVAVAASATLVGFELVAPPLLWIEVVSALHTAMWRGELRGDQAEPMLKASSRRACQACRAQTAADQRLGCGRRVRLGEGSQSPRLAVKRLSK